MGIWLALTGAFAVGDWSAVVRRTKTVEYVCKPATMVALTAVALSLDPRAGAGRGWFVAALVFSLAGDVFLMLPQDLFVFGLGSFLVAHLAYIAGLNVDGGSAAALAASAVAVAVVAAVVARPILGAVWRGDDPALRVPVVVYMVAISVMVASAVASGRPLAIAGAALFFASDATIAWNRFVTPRPWMPLFIIVTYHLGQAGLVLSLAR
ncbi:MAG TPA: lysoplasmalogenase [Acidimicrobiales bacterium]|nr:lysoplasmalogenase [Acidimicrobiales bacterium]